MKCKFNLLYFQEQVVCNLKRIKIYSLKIEDSNLLYFDPLKSDKNGPGGGIFEQTRNERV